MCINTCPFFPRGETITLSFVLRGEMKLTTAVTEVVVERGILLMWEPASLMNAGLHEVVGQLVSPTK